MDEVRITIHPNTVAISELGNQTLSGLAQELSEWGSVEYEPDSAVIVVKENETTGAGAEFWEIVEVTVVFAASVVSEAIVSQIIAEIMARFSSSYEKNTRSYPQNHQTGFPWEHRRILLKFRSVTTRPNGQTVEKEKSIELSSEKHISKDS